MKYYLLALKKYAVFSGLANRKEYWNFILINTILYILYRLFEIFSNAIGIFYISPIWPTIYFIATIVPSIAASVRRMHDVGKSGWFLLVPIYNLILLATPSVINSDKHETNLEEGEMIIKQQSTPQLIKPSKYIIFRWGRLKFYSVLFLINIFVLTLAIIIMRLFSSGYDGMSGLATGLGLAVLLIVLYIALFIISISLISVYENKMTIERNKRKYLKIVYVILFLSIITWPFVAEIVGRSVGGIIEYWQDARGKKYYDKLNGFINNNDLEGCLKSFPVDFNKGGYTIDCRDSFAVLRKDISLCPDRDDNCALPVIEKIVKDQQLISKSDTAYLKSLCQSSKLTPFYQNTCLKKYVGNETPGSIVSKVTIPSCSDSDHGTNMEQKGTTTMIFGTGEIVIKTDYCNDDGSIIKWYCGGNSGNPTGVFPWKVNSCPDDLICRDGACVK